MAFSPLADMKRRIPDVGRSSPRLYAISGVGVHYQYGKNIHTEATNPAREVSANYWIDDDGTIRPNIDENLRAWTSGDDDYPAGALADHRNITVEVSCIGSNTDRISAAALAALIGLIADIYKRHKLGTIKRSATRGVGVHSDWVATACPGDYMRDRLPSIIRDANQINQGGLTMADMKSIERKLDQIISTQKKDKTSIDGKFSVIANAVNWIRARIGGWLGSKTLASLLGDLSKSDITPEEYADAVVEQMGESLAADVVNELSKRLSEK